MVFFFLFSSLGKIPYIAIQSTNTHLRYMESIVVVYIHYICLHCKYSNYQIYNLSLFPNLTYLNCSKSQLNFLYKILTFSNAAKLKLTYVEPPLKTEMVKINYQYQSSVLVSTFHLIHLAQLSR